MRPRGRTGGRRTGGLGFIRSLLAWGAVLALLVPTDGLARPHGYPRSYDRIVEEANKESVLVIYTTTHKKVASDLFAGFHRLYPQIHITYVDGTAAYLNDRLVSEISHHQPTADLIWSSAVDLQAKLINDGYAQVYSSPEKPSLPSLAVWKDEGYGVSYEPIVMAYNKRLTPARDVPHSHLELAALLRQRLRAYQGRVATYDPEVSEIGRLALFHDAQATHDTWDLVRALGAAHVRFYATSTEMLAALAKGQILLGYNIIGSSAFEAEQRDPAIGVILPQDYLLTALPIALIPAEARHPNAAKVFLDFLLSHDGQAILERHQMTPVRLDLASSLGWNPAESGRVRTIRVGPSLLADLDQQNRARLDRDWRRAMAAH